jgi:hypothetical protein
MQSRLWLTAHEKRRAYLGDIEDPTTTTWQGIVLVARGELGELVFDVADLFVLVLRVRWGLLRRSGQSHLIVVF